MWIKTSLVINISVWLASTAVACGFHNYVPRATLVDQLSNSSALVLARPSQENPFRFTSIETIAGHAVDPDIPHLVDSVTRRKLSHSKDTYVLFAQNDQNGAWARIAFVDQRMSQILAFVMPRLDGWQLDEDRGRFEYFASLIEDKDPIVQQLALREIDQADYATLRSLDLAPDAQWLIARMHTASELDLLPIRILLLGFSDGDAATERLETGLARVAPIANNLVGAYATAYIEQSGTRAVAEISGRYIADSELPTTSLESLMEALAIHRRSADPEVADAVDRVVKNALATDPATFSALVARRFGARQDWAYAEPLTQALRDMAVRDTSDMIAVAEYVASARSAQKRSVN